MSVSGHTRSAGDWVGVQKKTFTRWCNTYMQRENMKFEDIYDDMEDGVKLNHLLRIISNGGDLGDGKKFKFKVSRRQLFVHHINFRII